MYIIKITPCESGARPPLQTWDSPAAPAGYAFCPDEFVEVFYSTDPAGFVNITVENDTVTDMSVNQEALEAYIESMPEPDPDPEPIPESEAVTWDELDAAYQEGVDSI